MYRAKVGGNREKGKRQRRWVDSARLLKSGIELIVRQEHEEISGGMVKAEHRVGREGGGKFN